MKVLSYKEYKEFWNSIKGFLEADRYKEMKNYMQHGDTTTYEHCIVVARLCFWLNRRFKFKANEKELLTGAMLHDLYLYDWHDKDNGYHNLHGFTHPKRAAANARRFFNVTDKEKNAIETHMWPLTIGKVPKCKEAWILCGADKIIAFFETFKMKKFLTV